MSQILPWSRSTGLNFEFNDLDAGKRKSRKTVDGRDSSNKLSALLHYIVARRPKCLMSAVTFDGATRVDSLNHSIL